MGLVKCVRHAEKKEREMPEKKKLQTCQHTVPALNLFPISGNLWEPGLWSLILFSSVPLQHPPHLYHTFNSTCWCLCAIFI